MTRPIVLELDSLNDDEKALLMMFILTTVYEYAKATRKSGSPLKHVLVVEEAHNLIGRGGRQSNEYRAIRARWLLIYLYGCWLRCAP